jgi:signal transduction histidine kinase
MTGLAVKLPRRTVRLRLTLLYTGLFLASTACLLALTYFLVAQALPQVTGEQSGPTSAGGFFIQTSQSLSGGPGLGTGAGPGCPGSATGAAATPKQMTTCVDYLVRQNVTLRSDTLDQLLVWSGIGLGIMAVASVGLGWLIAGRVLRPLRLITATARRVSARNLHQRIAMTGPDDELKELGDTFDELLGRLEASFRAQRQFVANASHELRTPLARQRTLLEVALRDKQATVGSLRTACERAVAAGEQHERLIGAMLTLARGERGLDQFDAFDLAVIAEEALLAGGTGGLEVAADLAPAPALGDPGLAERLVANLLDNAIRYNEPGGRLEISTGMRGGCPFFAVSNSGPVIPADQLGRLFQPFERMPVVRGTGQDGLGLGLAIVSAIATAHDAELRARPGGLGGLDVEIVFPAGEPAFASAMPEDHFSHSLARARNSPRSRSLLVRAAASVNCRRASSGRPSLASRSPRTAGSWTYPGMGGSSFTISRPRSAPNAMLTATARFSSTTGDGVR